MTTDFERYATEKDAKAMQRLAEKACNQMVGRALGWEVVNAIFQDRAEKHPRYESVLRKQANRLLRR